MNDVKAPVVVRSVRQSYGGREVLHGIDLSVEHNSFHCIIGPNGAGKTTLIEIIHGARRPRTGTIRLLGRPPLPRDPALLARIGVQSQAAAFFSHATAWEHLSTIASLFGASQARAEQLMEIMGLGRVRSSRVERLSGGERQKLAIASAVIHHPEVLFLDEPTAALDATARHDLAELLTTMREEGTTIICTTCCPSEAEHLCDTVSILEAGRLLTTASPTTLTAGTVPSAILLPPDAADYLDTITALPGIHHARTAPNGILIQVHNRDQALAALKQAGISTARAQIHVPTLEDAYIKIIRDERPDRQ